MTETGESQRQFAQRIGLSHGRISQLVKVRCTLPCHRTICPDDGAVARLLLTLAISMGCMLRHPNVERRLFA